jgi:hypothetical protein
MMDQTYELLKEILRELKEMKKLMNEKFSDDKGFKNITNERIKNIEDSVKNIRS